MAEFVTNGVRVSRGDDEGEADQEVGITQESGVTHNNFTAPVEYRVTAGDGTSVIYTVRILRVISSSDELSLLRLAEFRGGDYVLANDIDLSSFESWIPIGRNTNISFTGTFDGQGFTITGLTIDSTSLDSEWGRGLFGVVRGATIANVTLEGVSISGDSRVGTGARVGKIRNAGNDRTLVRNCHATGSISSSRGLVGGLIGHAETYYTRYVHEDQSISVINSSADCNVTSDSHAAGGLLGHVNVSGNGTVVVSGCSARGAVVGKGAAGGLIGSVLVLDISEIYIADSNASGSVEAQEGSGIGGFIGRLSSSDHTARRQGVVVTGCSATGNVSAPNSDNVGGFVGAAGAAGGKLILETSRSHGSVHGRSNDGGYVGLTGWTGGGQNRLVSAYKCCYATGDVTAAGDCVGGFAGSASTGKVMNSLYDSKTSGQSDNTGKGTPWDTTNMKSKRTFLDASRDYVGETQNGTQGIWNIDPTYAINDGYPYLEAVTLKTADNQIITVLSNRLE